MYEKHEKQEKARKQAPPAYITYLNLTKFHRKNTKYLLYRSLFIQKSPIY